MIHPFKRIWLPRYRLRTLLLFVTICCLGIAWISHNLREYSAEQAAIAKLFSQAPTSANYTLLDDDKAQRLMGTKSKNWQSESVLIFM